MELNKENLYNEYILKKQTVKDVSLIFNVSESIIKRRLQKYNIHKERKEIFNQSKEKYNKTMLSRYGTIIPMRNKEIKQKVENIFLDKYGVKYALQSNDVKEKIKESNRKKFGVDYGVQCKDVIEKRKKTCIKKYGVDNPAKCDSVKEKIKKTCLQKYGVENVGGTKESIKKAQDTMLQKYGVKQSMFSQEIRNKIEKTNMDKFNVAYFCMTDVCKNSNGFTISKINKDFSNLLLTHKINNRLEKNIEKYAYDIEISNSNIILEINPTYTHNSTNSCWFNKHKRKPIEKDYHIKKTLVAKENGYRCIHIWDWDDKEKIINILKPKEKIYARNCDCKEINEEECVKFLEKNHLQGNCRGQKIMIGLFLDDKLVEVMTFGNPRYNKKYEWELLRLCSDFEYNIIGGANKLFTYFLINYNPNSIISYCDNSKFDGNVYNKLGFELLNYGKPSKHWYNVKNKVHITDNLLRQRGYDQLFKTNYGKGTSNNQLMIDSGFVEIYDCGQSTYIWNK